MTCDYCLKVFTAWDTAHRRFLSYCTRISFQKQSSAWEWFSLHRNWIFLSFNAADPDHSSNTQMTPTQLPLLLPPCCLLTTLCITNAETDCGTSQIEKEHRKKGVLFQLHLHRGLTCHIALSMRHTSSTDEGWVEMSRKKTASKGRSV